MPSVLLIEDDKTIALGLCYSLEQEGYQVTACYSAASALEQIKANNFTLAILDLALPDGNGYDLCRAIKSAHDTPVIFLTVCDEEVNVVMGLDMGADDYITKPFRLQELLSRIRTVLRRMGKRADAEDELHICGLTLYLKQAKVKKDGQEIFLSALEYRLLLTLALNHGKVLSRNQLLEGIWDIAGNFVNDNTLTVYIKRLREKIGDDPQNPFIIRTVRGLGYRMGE